MFFPSGAKFNRFFNNFLLRAESDEYARALALSTKFTSKGFKFTRDMLSAILTAKVLTLLLGRFLIAGFCLRYPTHHLEKSLLVEKKSSNAGNLYQERRLIERLNLKSISYFERRLFGYRLVGNSRKLNKRWNFKGILINWMQVGACLRLMYTAKGMEELRAIARLYSEIFLLTPFLLDSGLRHYLSRREFSLDPIPVLSSDCGFYTHMLQVSSLAYTLPRYQPQADYFHVFQDPQLFKTSLCLDESVVCIDDPIGLPVGPDLVNRIVLNESYSYVLLCDRSMGDTSVFRPHHSLDLFDLVSAFVRRRGFGLIYRSKHTPQFLARMLGIERMKIFDSSNFKEGRFLLSVGEQDFRAFQSERIICAVGLGANTAISILAELGVNCYSYVPTPGDGRADPEIRPGVVLPPYFTTQDQLLAHLENVL